MHHVNDAEATRLKAIDIVDQALSHVEGAQRSIFWWNGRLCHCLYGDELLAGEHTGVIHMYCMSSSLPVADASQDIHGSDRSTQELIDAID